MQYPVSFRTLRAAIAAVAVAGLAACAGAARLTLSQFMSFRGPTWITVDTTTGLLTGTVIGAGTVSFRLTLNVDGYANPIIVGVDFFM